MADDDEPDEPVPSEPRATMLRDAVAAAVDSTVADAIMASVVGSVADAIADRTSPKVLAEMQRVFGGVSAAVDSAVSASTETAIARAVRRSTFRLPLLDLTPLRSERPSFRLLFGEQRCRDCGEISHRFVCRCGLERGLSDEFFVVDGFAPVRWTRNGPVPRLTGLGSFDLYRIRDAARAAELVDDGAGWGGGSDAGYGFGNGAGWGGGLDDVAGINDAFTASYLDAAAGADVAGADAAGDADADAAAADAGPDDYAFRAAADAAPDIYFEVAGPSGEFADDEIARENFVERIVESFERSSRR